MLWRRPLNDYQIFILDFSGRYYDVQNLLALKCERGLTVGIRLNPLFFLGGSPNYPIIFKTKAYLKNQLAR
jgi:hypothetical protein